MLPQGSVNICLVLSGAVSSSIGSMSKLFAVNSSQRPGHVTNRPANQMYVGISFGSFTKTLHTLTCDVTWM